MHISILTCSRGRPKGLKRLIQTAHELSSGKHRISFENYIDFDDPSYPHYAEELKVFEMLENSITLGVPQSVSKSWDELANLAIKKEADICVLNNDNGSVDVCIEIKLLKEKKSVPTLNILKY